MDHLKYYLLILWMVAAFPGYSQPMPLSHAQFLEDLSVLEAKLKQHHPNLYTYQTPKSIEAHLASLRKDSGENMTPRQAYASISSMCAMIQDGHIVALPSTERLVEYEQSQALFPFDVIAKADRLFVVRDYQAVENLPAGTEILRLDGMPAAELIGFIRRRLPADEAQGNYANWLLNTYFRAYYFFFFPAQETFNLDVKHPDGDTETIKIEGASLAQVEQVCKERFPKHAAVLTTQNKQPIRFDLQAEEGLAILTIGDFHRSVHRKAGQKFKRVIDGAMAELAREKVEHLIIDLRDNQGGDLQLGHYLLRYLLDEPFQTVDHFASVKHPEAASDVQRVKRSKNRLSQEVEPREDRYHGKVYLLTNGGSFSNSGIFSWMIRKHQCGLIFGSATGGSSWQLCGGPNKRIRLPNSGIQVEIPTNRYALHPTGGKRGSVVPDKIIQPTAVDLAEGNDLALDTVLTMIKSARNQ